MHLIKNIYFKIRVVLLVIVINGCTHEKSELVTLVNEPYLLDMVFNNPGEEETISNFTNPEYVKSLGYKGMVPQWFINCAITYDNFEEGIVPKESKERAWIESRAEIIDAKLEVCDEVGMNVYAFTDVFIAPKSIWEKYGEAMGAKETNLGGYGGDVENVRKPSIQSELIQQLVRAQIEGVFDRFPSLDGLVIRFGETYLHDTPFHMGGKPVRQGEEGIQDHITLLNILKEEICIKRNKKLFYRTWDFGWLHTRPDVYSAITDAVEPHDNLIFSIKHTKGDFLRNHDFNPTLGIGKHQQIVEVQCQREYEGKGAHPNYIAESVINGFEEYEGKKGIQSLTDLKSNQNFKGVWTWSRGGGWKGPYISNELWSDLNTYVMSQWTLDNNLSEADIFKDYCKKLGLNTQDAETFREIALLSNRGVLLGHYSKLTWLNPTWIRDEFMGGIGIGKEGVPTKNGRGKLNRNFFDILDKGIVNEILEEKKEAVKIWRKIEKLSQNITSGDEKLRAYIKVSSTYGRIKYEIIQQAWIVMLKGIEGDQRETHEIEMIKEAIQNYDNLWVAFTQLKAENEQCASLYVPYGFNNDVPELHTEQGMDLTINYYRKLLE